MNLHEKYNLHFREQFCFSVVKHLAMAALLRFFLTWAFLMSTTLSLQQLFYRKSCPQAEMVVQRVVKLHFQEDPSIPAGLLRLHFHDCFVQGCDGSILIDSTADNVAEKEAPPNLTLRGFEIIDEIKSELERECKGIVSCADILALAARDGVALTGGAAYNLPTGRRDGTVSFVGNVHIPSPSSSVGDALNAFQAINLTLSDLTTLLGAHSIGFCHCGFFIDRLYNFLGSGFPDPTMDPSVVERLQKTCPQSDQQNVNISTDPKVFMNQITNAISILDQSFYQGVLNGSSVLQLDQELAFTDFTSEMVGKYVKNPLVFKRNFGKAMIKLGNVGVLTGKEGEIRENCRVVNRNNK